MTLRERIELWQLRRWKRRAVRESELLKLRHLREQAEWFAREFPQSPARTGRGPARKRCAA
jgi:hypothetical protein